MPIVACGLDYDKLTVRVYDISNRPDSRWICADCIRAEDDAATTELYCDHPRSWAARNHQPYHWHLVVADEPRRLTLHERVARLPEWLLAQVVVCSYAGTWWSPEDWEYESEEIGALSVKRLGTIEEIDVDDTGVVMGDYVEDRMRVLEAVAAHWRSVRKAAGVDNDTDEWPKP